MASELIERLKTHPLVYNGQRCVTSRHIDEMHGKADKTAINAFNRNKEHFTEGKHFYSLAYKEFRGLVASDATNPGKGGNPNQRVILFPERGYVMLAKVFDDDRAWAIQEELVDGYFRWREESPTSPDTNALLAAALGRVADAIDQQGERLDRLERMTASVMSPAVTLAGPRFVICDRLRELLAIHDLNPKDGWRNRVVRRTAGEAELLAIPVFQSRERGVIELSMEFLPWAEKVMMRFIRELLANRQCSLFDGIPSAKKGDHV